MHQWCTLAFVNDEKHQDRESLSVPPVPAVVHPTQPESEAVREVQKPVLEQDAITNEEFYDREIAPELLRLCKMCQDRGMGFAASVEYDPRNWGIGVTEFQPPDEFDKMSPAQRLAHWAIRSKGNIDKLFLACDRHGQKHGHTSVYLKLAGNNNEKDDPNAPPQMAAITVMGPAQ